MGCAREMSGPGSSCVRAELPRWVSPCYPFPECLLGPCPGQHKAGLQNFTVPVCKTELSWLCLGLQALWAPLQ